MHHSVYFDYGFAGWRFTVVPFGLFTPTALLQTCYCVSFNLFHNLLQEAIALQKDQNTDEQSQRKETISSESSAVLPSAASNQVTNETPDQTTQSEAVNSKQETDPMEVHKHPHHVTHKKKWNEYLLEFLMIFFAVFLGFVAENIREHLADKKRGEEYVTSFLEDLKKDTAQYTRLIEELTDQNSITNNIVNCYDSVSRDVTSTNCLNDIARNLVGFTDFVYTDRTILQLKNAGGLSLIKDKSIADSIPSYDADVRTELIHQEGLEIYQQKTIDATKAIVDFRSFSNIYSRNFRHQGNIELLQNSKQAIDNFFNSLWVFKANLRGQIAALQRLKNKASRLIVFLNGK